MVAALFVDPEGPYSEVPDCDLWGVERDARKYAGPYRVIAHPPCQRWGRYAKGGPSVKVPLIPGDDGDCFAAALRAVRHWGGVLEHPAHSLAWEWFGLEKPSAAGGWTAEDRWGGASCHVEQGHYGHRARKATWLYSTLSKPYLMRGPSSAAARLDDGFHSKEERAVAKAGGWVSSVERLSKAERIHTPIPFRDVLLSIVRPSALGAR